MSLEHPKLRELHLRVSPRERAAYPAARHFSGLITVAVLPGVRCDSPTYR